MTTRETESERRPGRPEVGRVINVRLPHDMLGQITDRAQNRGVSRAVMIREMLAESLDGPDVV